MPLVDKGDFEDTPLIPEDFYIAELANIRSYERDNSESAGLVIELLIESDGEEATLPFFAPAKLSISEDRESSRLGENLEKIDRLETVLEIMDIEPTEITGGRKKWFAETTDEAEDLVNALRSVLLDQDIRVMVEDQQDGQSSQIGNFSRIVEDGE